MTKPVPAGFHTLTPHLVVADGAAAIEFYKKAFGAQENTRLMTPDGKTVMHAQLTIGNSVFMLGSEMPPNALSPKSRGGTSVFLHLYLPDADAAFDRAVKAGCIIRMPVSDTFWGDRYGVVEDPSGLNGLLPRTSTTGHRNKSPPTPRNSLPRCPSVDMNNGETAMKKQTPTNIIVVIGAGSIGQAIARRVSAGKHVLLADLRQENAEAAAKTLSEAGFDVTTAKVDVSSRNSVHALVEKATALGKVSGVIHAAGVSPSQASPETILKVDLYGTALVLEEFGNVIAHGGAGVVIASQSGHRLPPLSVGQNAALATTPVEELLKLPMLQPDQVKDSLHAYQLSKRGNSLRVMAEAVHWGKRGARINTISPGIIITPLAKDELTGPRGAGYRRMIELSAAGRAGTPDEVGTVGALLMGVDGAFITGSDFLMDGGVTAAYWFGELRPK